MCPDCIAGKHTHFGSHSGLPEVTVPGEIVAFELLILRTPDAYTNGTIIFGAIDLHSDWDLIIKIKFKTDVPECLNPFPLPGNGGHLESPYRVAREI